MSLSNETGVVGILRWVGSIAVVVLIVVAVVEMLMVVVEKPAGSKAPAGATKAEAAARKPRPWKKEDARPHSS